MIAETIPALSALSADQKILLAAELWHDAVGKGAQEPSDELIFALQERLDHYRANPGEVSSWEQVRSRILSRQTS